MLTRRYLNQVVMCSSNPLKVCLAFQGLQAKLSKGENLPDLMIALQKVAFEALSEEARSLLLLRDKASSPARVCHEYDRISYLWRNNPMRTIRAKWTALRDHAWNLLDLEDRFTLGGLG